MPLRVGLDASASATKRPTGVARAISSLVGSLRAIGAAGASDALDLSVLYRLSRLRRRSTFLPGGRLFHERFSWLLARRLDVFHGPDARLPRLAGPRLVATIHDLSVRKDARFAEPGFRATRARHWEDSARRADRLVCYTHAVRLEVSRELGFPLERIDVVPLAATGEHPVPGGVESVRARLDLAGDLVLVLGELSARKNSAGAVRAFARARARGGRASRATLLLVGPDGHGADETRAAIAAARLGDAVRVLGWLERGELASLLAAARLLFFPSRSEGFGLPVLEAFRADLPVLASREPALVEVAGGAALHADAEDEEALAQGLERLLEDEPLRADLVARGRERGAAFSWERSARSLLATYRAAAGLARLAAGGAA